LSATGTRGSFTMPHSMASISEKSLMAQHIKYAAGKGTLDEIDDFLRSLTPDQWHKDDGNL